MGLKTLRIKSVIGSFSVSIFWQGRKSKPSRNCQLKVPLTLYCCINKVRYSRLLKIIIEGMYTDKTPEKCANWDKTPELFFRGGGWVSRQNPKLFLKNLNEKVKFRVLHWISDYSI